jgi:hypothetical protein
MNVDETPYRHWDVDDDVADAAGISAKAKGKQRERQVPLSSRNKHLLTTPQCTRGSTPTKAKEEQLIVGIFRNPSQCITMRHNSVHGPTGSLVWTTRCDKLVI